MSPRRSGPHAISAGDAITAAPRLVLSLRPASAPRSTARGFLTRRVRGTRLVAAAAADVGTVVLALAVASAAAATLPQ